MITTSRRSLLVGGPPGLTLRNTDVCLPIASSLNTEQLDLLQTLDVLSYSGLSVKRWVKYYIFGMSMAEIALVRSRARAGGMKRRLRQFVDVLSCEHGYIGLQQSFQDLWNAIVQDFYRENTCPRFPILAQ